MMLIYYHQSRIRKGMHVLICKFMLMTVPYICWMNGNSKTIALGILSTWSCMLDYSQQFFFVVIFLKYSLLLFRMMSDYTVETINDGLSEFNVEFHGPKESTVKILWLTYTFV